jgi:hypothetical protein
VEIFLTSPSGKLPVDVENSLVKQGEDPHLDAGAKAEVDETKMSVQMTLTGFMHLFIVQCLEL